MSQHDRSCIVKKGQEQKLPLEVSKWKAIISDYMCLFSTSSRFRHYTGTKLIGAIPQHISLP